MNNYKELKVWKKAVDLAINVYEVTNSFPDEEKYGITSQLRRSSVSISSNIAEGSGRNTPKDFSKFLSISYGSTCELETQLIIANRAGYLDQDRLIQLTNQIIEIQKMNYALKKSLSV